MYFFFVLAACVDMGHIQPITHARVPILKKISGRGPPYDISVDRGLGVVNSQMIHHYVSLDERVKPLCQLAKKWSKTYSINDSQNSLLSSYAFVLLVLSFLQRRLVIPNLQQGTSPHRHIVECLDCTYQERSDWRVRAVEEEEEEEEEEEVVVVVVK
jgi:DNA polymerase sigma